MASSTSPDGIVYPDASDPIAPLNTVFQDLAESVQDAFDNLQTGATICTNATIPATPFAGQIILNTDTSVASIWDGSAWIDLN